MRLDYAVRGSMGVSKWLYGQTEFAPRSRGLKLTSLSRASLWALDQKLGLVLQQLCPQHQTPNYPLQLYSRKRHVVLEFVSLWLIGLTRKACAYALNQSFGVSAGLCWFEARRVHSRSRLRQGRVMPRLSARARLWRWLRHVAPGRSLSSSLPLGQ